MRQSHPDRVSSSRRDFAVADATTERDPSFLADIGEIWARPSFQVITEFLGRLREAGTLEPEDEAADSRRAHRLEGLKSYPFTALVLGADIDEERVAEVFVRVNSQGRTSTKRTSS